jgi:hypothetical protein
MDRISRLLIELAVGTLDPESFQISSEEVEKLAPRVDALGLQAHALHTLGPDRGGSHTNDTTLRWRAGLQRSVHQEAARNFRLDRQVREVASELRAQDIPTMILKGSAIRTAHPGMAGRPQGDVDLLVPEEDLDAAEAVLRAAGFTFQAGYQDREAYRRDHFHFPYARGGLVVELHWKPSGELPTGFLDRVWSEAVALEKPSGGEEPGGGKERSVSTLLTLAPAHRVLFSSLHISRHGFVGMLRWLGDLALELPLAPSGEERLLAEVRSWDPRRIHLPFWLLSRWGRMVPASLTEPARPHALEARFLEGVLTELALERSPGLVPRHRKVSALQAWMKGDSTLLGSVLRSGP